MTSRVDPKHHAGGFEAQEEIVERLGVGGRRHGVRSKPERHRRIGLDDGAIEHPGVTRAYPDDAVGLHAVRQQPHDPVGGGLAGTDDHVAVRRRGQPGELVDRDDADVVSNTERRGCRRGDRRRQVGGVDDAASHVDLHGLARHPGRHEMGGAVRVILAPPEEGDAARADEAAMQDVVVVGLDLRLTGPFLEPRLRAALLHGAATEHGRRDAVEQRRLMELDERIRVLPVPAGRVATVDERDVHVRVIDQGVREGHAHRARAHDEVVGLRRSHRHGARPPVRIGIWFSGPGAERLLPGLVSERKRTFDQLFRSLQNP